MYKRLAATVALTCSMCVGTATADPAPTPSPQAPQATPSPQAGPTQAPPPPPQSGPLGQAIPDAPIAPDTQWREPGATYPQSTTTDNDTPAPSPHHQTPQTIPPKPAPDTTPKPVPGPALTRPADSDRLGIDPYSIPRPDFIDPTAAYKFNRWESYSEYQVEQALNGLGVPRDGSLRTATGITAGASAGAGIGATVVAVPAAVAGGLIGGTIGGIVGAAAGTLVPVPILGTVTSGVAGTAAGAAIGAAAAGAAGAVVGGGVGGLLGAGVGAVLTSGPGSPQAPPSLIDPAPVPSPAPAAPPPGPAPASQWVPAAVHNTIDAGEQAVRSIQAQPGGQNVLTTANDVVDAGAHWVQAQPWAPVAAAAATQTVRNVVAAAKSAPQTAEVANAAARAVSNIAPFTHGEFGPLTGQVNDVLGAAKVVVR